MFELIGLFFATASLFFVATLAGGLFAGITWLVVRRRDLPVLRLMMVAVSIPIASAAYFWVCIAALPGESWFGDIAQPLPNGYILTALGKMPDFASIHRESSSDNATVPGLPEYVGTVAVVGPIVAGRYSHPFGEFKGSTNEHYFTFDTRNGSHADFADQASFEMALGQHVVLVETQFFRSPEPRYRWQQRINESIMFAPPITAVILYFAYLVRRRMATPPRAITPYT